MNIKEYCPYCDKVWETSKEIIVAGKRFRKSANCKHTVIGNQTKIVEEKSIYEQVISINGDHLRPFQISGIQFAEQANFNMLFGDDPGLGKTAQALACIRLHPEQLLPALIVCKAKLRVQLADQCMQWADLPAQIVEANYSKPTLFNKAIVIVSYDMIWRVKWDDKYWAKFKTIILDECQHMKNPESRRTKKIKEVKSKNPDTLKHIMGLSATPIKNNAKEYFPFLNLIRSDLFPTETGFIIRYVEMYDKNGYRKYGGIRPDALDRWKEVSSKFMIRRKIEDVANELPKVDRQFRNCALADEVADAYRKETTEFVELYEDGSALSFQKVQNLLAKIAIMRHLVALSKIDDTLEEIDEILLGTEQKVVIFCHHIDVQETMLRKLMQKCEEGGFEDPCWLKGGMTDEASNQVINHFVTSKSRVMVASTLAAGEGVDRLQQVCSYCIIHERQWNPANEMQAEGRLRRIGSILTGTGKHIIAKYMIAIGTIDEWFTKLVDSKRNHMSSTLDGKEVEMSEQSLTREMIDVIAREGRRFWTLNG